MQRVSKDGSFLIVITYRVFLDNYTAGEISKLWNLRLFTVSVKFLHQNMSPKTI